MKKRIAVLIGALLILCISFTSTVAVFEIDVFWRLIDNNTLTPLNESWNVSIGKNETTTCKFFVNGSFYANSLFGDGGNLTNISDVNGIRYWDKIGNTVVLKDVTDNVNIGENESTDYKLKVNGTSFFNDTLIVSTISNITVESDWWNTNWTYYKKITIDFDYIDSELTNFPILVSIDDATGDKCKANGEDIVFVLPDNSTVLNHEIEKWVDNDERLVWVNVTTIAPNVDTSILMYYGNVDASDSQNPSGVWDSNFMAVWHMNNLLDSTSNDIDLTNVGCDVGAVGKIGDCYSWVSANTDYMYHSTFLDVIPVSDELTFECWVYHSTDIDANYLSKNSNTDDDRFSFRRRLTFLELFAEASEGGNKFCIDTVATTIDAWHYQVGEIKSGIALKIYRDIVSTTGDVIGIFTDGSTSDFEIGRWYTGTDYMDGYFDEIRVSDIIRNDDWVNVTFHTQNQTTGFMVFGSEQEDIPPYYIIKKIDLLTVDTNSLQVNFTGVINLHNDSRVKRHVRVTAPSWKKGVTAPTDNQIGIFPVLSFDKNGDDIVYYSLIIPYRIETGSEIAVNVDWCYTGANDVGTVHWNLSYINVGIGESVDGALSYIEQTSLGYHVSGELVNTILTGNIQGAVAHDIIGLKLIRDTSEDTLDTDAHLIQVHFHFIEDKLGEPI